MYVDLRRFLDVVEAFTHVIFVEPLLLYDSSDLVWYLSVKAALMRVPHEVLHLPANVTSGPQLVVLQDVPPLDTLAASGDAAIAAAA